MDELRLSIIEDRITEEEDNLDDTLSQDSLKNGVIDSDTLDSCLDLNNGNDIDIGGLVQELRNGGINDKSASEDSLEAPSPPRSQHGGSAHSLSSDDSYTRKYVEDLSRCSKPAPVKAAAPAPAPIQKETKPKGTSPKTGIKKFIPRPKPKESPGVKRRNTIDNSDLRGSQNSLISVGSCTSMTSGSKGVAENKASRARRQMIHTNLHKPKAPDPITDYVTPFQRKEKTIHDLKQELKSARNEVNDLEIQLQNARESNVEDVKKAVESRDKEIEQLRELVDELRTTVTSVTLSQEQAVETASGLEYQLQELKQFLLNQFKSKVQTEEAERKHQEMYLKMYTKGLENAQNQRELELEELATAKPDEVKVGELIEKLKTTQSKLQRWQDLKRQEAYDTVEVPTSDAGMTLRFLKDCMFHYLTNSKTSNDHLRAMIQIMGFTDVQMNKIKKAQQSEKKHKSK